MKRVILIVSPLILGIWFVTSVVAQDVQCVVEAQPSYSTSSECKYSPYPYGSNPDFYDSCYQNYLIRKADWEKRCFRYWDEQKAKSNTPQPTQSPAGTQSNSNSETEELKRKLKETEEKLNILLTQAAQPKQPVMPPRIGIENPYDFFPYITPVEEISGENAELITPSPTAFPTPIPTAIRSFIQNLSSPLFVFFERIFALFRR